MNFSALAARAGAVTLLTAALALPTAAANAAPAPGTENDPVAIATRAVCHEWARNGQVRVEKSNASAAFSRNPNWRWDGIAPLIHSENAAIRTESAALPALISRAAGRPAVASALQNYRVALDQYGAAKIADLNARGYDENSWPRSRPATQRVNAASKAVDSACRPLWA